MIVHSCMYPGILAIKGASQARVPLFVINHTDLMPLFEAHLMQTAEWSTKQTHNWMRRQAILRASGWLVLCCRR